MNDLAKYMDNLDIECKKRSLDSTPLPNPAHPFSLTIFVKFHIKWTFPTWPRLFHEIRPDRFPSKNLIAFQYNTMIKNTRLFAICGGFYVCTPKWNRERATHKFQNTFDFILPLAGCATYETVGGVTDVTPGHVYFVPGCHMVRWTCSGEMPMYWAATMPESFYLRRRLEGERTLHEWPLAAAPSVEAVFRRFPEFFEEEKLYNDEQRTAKDSRPRQDPPTALGMKIEATLTFLAGDLIEATEKDFRWDNLASLERLRPAIDYMDSNFLRNPPLAEIAKHVGLAPDYLLRLFKKETGVTPHAYMLEQRLARARQLLTGTLQSVKEVALALGYDDPFYFSRQFMKAYGVSPKAFREQGSGLTQ